VPPSRAVVGKLRALRIYTHELPLLRTSMHPIEIESNL
jgi:hypothetical protein